MKIKSLLCLLAMVSLAPSARAANDVKPAQPEVFALQKSKETEASALWLSSRGQLMVVDSLDNTDGFAVWDVAARKMLWNRSDDYSLEISPDERVLVLAHANRPIRRDFPDLNSVRFEMHAARDGRLMGVLGSANTKPAFEAAEKILDATFSPDGREFRMATSLRLRRWNVASGQLLSNQKWQPTDHAPGVLVSASFVTDQERLVAFDDTFLVFDSRTGKQLQRFASDLTPPDEFLGVSPDNFSFVEEAGDEQSHVFRLSDGEELWHCSSFPTFSFDGKLAFVPTEKGVEVLNAHTGHQLRALPGPTVRFGWPPSFDVSRDGNWLYEAQGGKIWKWRAR